MAVSLHARVLPEKSHVMNIVVTRYLVAKDNRHWVLLSVSCHVVGQNIVTSVSFKL
jgi:hypothetical protein